jgi:hypothetical protein
MKMKNVKSKMKWLMSIVMIAVIGVGLFSCGDNEDNNQSNMIDFSVVINPCYYYNGIDPFTDYAALGDRLDSLITFNWNINDMERNSTYIINSQEEFLSYITIKEGESNPVVNFNQYSLIAVRVSTYSNLGKPIKTLQQISGNNYTLTFDFHVVAGAMDASERTWVQAFLVPKIPSTAHIDFALNIIE